MAKKTLKSTHEGKLKLGDAELDVAVLEDGTRVITQTAVFRALGRPHRGTKRGINLPTFMDAKNLTPFISSELNDIIDRIKYKDKNGNEQEGYDASIIPLVSDLYLRAREAKALHSTQFETALKSEILVRSLAKLGITALVDEATGYQYKREKDELQKILKAYINEELLPWQKRFPDIFYREIFRLNGWDFTVNGIQNRPSVIGTWTNNLIYRRLPKGVLEELKSNTPIDDKGRRTHRFHQLLTEDVGNPHLQQQITAVITIMRLSKDWKDFERQFNQLYGQTALDLNFEEVEPKKKLVEPKGFDKQLKQALDFNPNKD